MGAPIKILVADALPLYGEALAVALGVQPDFEVFTERPFNGPATVAAAGRLKPDVALVDFWMPDMEGPAVAESVISRAPSCRVILLSWLSAQDQVRRALNSGAAGFLLKDCSLAQLTDAIRQAHAGQDLVHADKIVELQEVLTERIDRSAEHWEQLQKLSAREVEILALLNTGMTISDIGKRLSLTPKTIRNRISQILSKTQTQSQMELIAKAKGAGFIE